MIPFCLLVIQAAAGVLVFVMILRLVLLPLALDVIREFQRCRR